MAKAQQKTVLKDALETPKEGLTLRQKLRGQILGTPHRGKSEIIKFHGARIEVRQPSLGAVLKLQEEGNRDTAIARMIVQYVYVPGTDELVFEDHDIPAILKMPMDEGMTALNKAITEMTGVRIEEEEKNSSETPASD